MNLSINGHKVVGSTANKFATLNTTYFSGGAIVYKIVNGNCYVLITQITGNSSAVGVDVVMATGLPKCGLYSSFPIWNGNIQNMGFAYIQEGTTQIIGHPHNTDMFWCSFIYPVADDWHE